MNSISSIIFCSLSFIWSETSGQVLSSTNQNIQQPYKSGHQLRAEELVRRTDPDYYKKQLALTYSPPHSNLRTQADCGNDYLCNNALPVTLVRIEAERKEVDQVEVTWETASETNNQGFEVERSFTGINDFEKVGYIDGAGNSSRSKEYRFLDHNSHAGWSYYRLNQLDWDGTHVYSRIVAVKGYEVPFTITVSPNPSTQQNIVFALDGIGANGNNGNVELHIYNQAGQILFQQSDPELDAQQHIVGSMLPHLEMGRYYFKVLAGSQSGVAPFVIVP
ncbi:hypothetical protein [Dyadobacter tibetensis]|uniref:hypothetical protein n=1 Tax=Dyadobacter tibetensis TaxID=1211851 RepID=UPI0004703F50|nr:hypothetical protein [Dyadobacter tibetensis]